MIRHQARAAEYRRCDEMGVDETDSAAHALTLLDELEHFRTVRLSRATEGVVLVIPPDKLVGSSEHGAGRSPLGVFFSPPRPIPPVNEARQRVGLRERQSTHERRLP